MIDPRPRKPSLFPLPASKDEAGRSEWRRRLFGMDAYHQGVTLLCQWGEWFARQAILNRRPGWLILAGKTGCGKTRVAKRVCRFLRDYALDAYHAGKWEGGVYIPGPWGDRGALLRVEFRDWPRTVETKGLDYDEAIEDVLRADVVILDDVGAETDPYKSGEPLSRLRSLLSRLEGKAVLITTNLKTADWEARDERIASRMSRARRFEGFDIPDFRPRIATQQARQRVPALT